MYGNNQIYGSSLGNSWGYWGPFHPYMMSGSSSESAPTFLASEFSELITKIKNGSIGSELFLDKRIEQQKFVEITKAMCTPHSMITSLVYLHKSNRIIAEDIQEAVPFLRDNVWLTSIQIRYTEIDDNNIQYWLEILHSNIFITKLEMPISNSIDRALRSRLDAYLQRNNFISHEIEQSNHYIAAIIVARAGRIPDVLTKNIIFEYCDEHADVAEARLINQMIYSCAFQYVNALENSWKKSNKDKTKMYSTIANNYLPCFQRSLDFESFKIFYEHDGAEISHIHIEQPKDQLEPKEPENEKHTKSKSIPLLFSTKEDRMALVKQFKACSNDSAYAGNCFPNCCIL